MASSSSNRRGTRRPPVIVVDCSRCSSVTSPVVVTLVCDHKFCAKCILSLWSRQKLREPCVCPFDGHKIVYIRPSTLDEPEEIASLSDVYNRLFHPNPPPDMAQAKLGSFMTRLYCVDMALFLTGLFAYYVKIRSGDGP